MTYRLERWEYTSSDLVIRFYYSRLTSNKIGVYYFIEKDSGYEDVKNTTVDVIPGDGESMAEFIISGLKSGTEYTVRMCPINAEGEFYIEDFLVEGKFYTEESYDAPEFKSFSVKAEDGKINCDFSIYNLNVEKISAVYIYDSTVRLKINGSFVEAWDGNDIVVDDKTGEVPRGTLNVTREYDFPSEESCVVRIEASNVCTNIITETDVYHEGTFREKMVFFSFAWELPKVVGERIRLGANEWNGFIGRIKDKLSQKGISYSKEFTTAVSAGFVGRNVGTSADGLSLESPKVISKKILCEAVDALNAMLPADEKISYPTGIAVDFLNNIVDKLNSI